MKMTNDEKVVYNGLVKRLKDAEKYMNNNKIAIEERLQHKGELQQLMRDMHTIAKKFKLTEDEMLNGIK